MAATTVKWFFLLGVALLFASPSAQAVSIMYTYQTPAHLQGDLAILKSLNIDVIMNYNNGAGDTLPTVQSHVDYLNALQSAGLKAIVDLRRFTMSTTPDLSGVEAVVSGIKNHPALYGWYTADEPTAAGFPLPQREAVYSHIKRLDPDHPVWEVYPGYGADWWPDATVASPYAETAHDLFGVDNYPASVKSWSESSFATELTGAYSVTTAKDMANLIGIVQVYGGAAGLAVPSPSTVSFMAKAYGSVGWNSKGIAFWLWDIEPGLYPSLGAASFLKGNAPLWSTVSTIAAAHHETLYPEAEPPGFTAIIFGQRFTLGAGTFGR